MPFSIVLKKESFKFSASHFTIFSETEAEALHGHNYYVMAELFFDQLNDYEMTVEFQKPKSTLQSICNELDERVLIGEKSPHLQITNDANHINVSYSERKYQFPKDDVYLIPYKNVTSEALAHYVHTKMAQSIAGSNLKIGIQETSGQTAYYSS